MAEEIDEETAEKGDRWKAFSKREAAVAENMLEQYPGLRHVPGLSTQSACASTGPGTVSTESPSILDVPSA
eukprot:316167-Amphidinium_carterae.3